MLQPVGMVRHWSCVLRYMLSEWLPNSSNLSPSAAADCQADYCCSFSVSNSKTDTKSNTKRAHRDTIDSSHADSVGKSFAGRNSRVPNWLHWFNFNRRLQ